MGRMEQGEGSKSGIGEFAGRRESWMIEITLQSPSGDLCKARSRRFS